MKSNNNLTSFLWKFIRNQKGKFFFIFLLSLFWSVDVVMGPYFLGKMTDVLVHYEGDRHAVWSQLKWLLLCILSLWVLVEIASRLRGFLEAKTFPRMEAEIRMNLFDHVQRHSPQYFIEHFAGSLTTKINDLASEASYWIQHTAEVFFPTLVSCIVTILLFSKTDPLFALILGGWIVFHFGIWLLFASRCAKAASIHGEARSSLTGKIVDSLTNYFAVNLFFRFCFEKRRITFHQREEQQKNWEVQRYIQTVSSVIAAISFLIMLAFTVFLFFDWSRGNISTGEVVQIFNTTTNVGYMIMLAGGYIPFLFQAIGIAKQAFSVMQDPQDLGDVPSARPLFVRKGDIVFDNVTFHYRNQQIFSGKNAHIRGGEKVGLVGYSGSGKTTFVNLILRFYPLTSGRILIDGQDIAQVTLESLRRQVALIPQDPALFHRTLEENIRYGRLDASREEVIAAAKLAHADEFIRKLPQGYESLVGERGTKLSGGERQRIAIARAILAQAPILLLDEATSALDSVTERYIQDSLDKLMENRTCIVIAHRLSTLDKMDRLLVFDQGKIVEEGSHEQLLAQGGHYAHLWEMQAGGFLPSG